MKTKLIIAIGCMLIFLAIPALAYDVNKDLKNLGPNAYDIAVELSGSETVIRHFDGYGNGYFSSFSSGPITGATKLHWQNFNDGVDNIIETNKVIHVGWTTSDHSSNVKDMYWTDASGNKISGSIVFNITSGWKYEYDASVSLIWDNLFSSSITITDVRYRISNDSILLANLNNQNSSLDTAAMTPLAGGTTFTVLPGAKQTIKLSAAVAGGQWVVLRYNVTATGTSAAVTDFVQFQIPASPTLSEWGLIVFSLLILTLVTVVVVRRRTAMTAAGAGSDVSTTIHGPLFIPQLYFKTLLVTLGMAAVVLVVATILSTSVPIRDFAGTIISAAIVAYMAHLWLHSAKKE